MSVAMRMHGLVLKEIKQIVRDPSAILIAFLMPVVLLIVNGFGINFDANHMSSPWSSPRPRRQCTA